MRQIILRGCAVERGQQLGETFRCEIQDRVEAFTAAALTNKLAEFAPQYRAVLEYMQQHTPELIDQMRGMAQGAGCEFKAVFYQHCASAIEATKAADDSKQQCSAFAAITVDAGAVLGNTVDFCKPRMPISYYGEQGFVLQREIPLSGPRYVRVCRVGTLWGGLGINEEGLACGSLSVPAAPAQTGGGISYLLIAPALVARAKTTTEAIELLQGWVQLGNSKCWPVIDGQGRYVAVEKSFNRAAVLEPKGGLLFHANDYLCPQMHDLADGQQHSKDRIAVLERRFRRARENSEPINLKFVAGCLRLHAEAGSICRHGQPGPIDDRYYTIAAALFIPARREVQLIAGVHPCRGRLETFSFDF